MADDIQQTPFVKQLASSDRKVRDAALSSLTTYLSSQHRTFPSIDLLKLHKGLFYCMWMSDRPLVQQQLASDLASLLKILPEKNVVPYLTAFWETMAREWTLIDVLRMEKFLLLCRRVVGVSFEVLREGEKKGKKGGKGEWGEERMKEVLEVYETIPLNVGDHRLPNGLRYHVIEVWVDEIERVGVLELEDEETARVLEILLEPLRKLRTDSPTKTVREKAKEALADERLPGNEKVEGEQKDEEQGDGEVWGGFDD